MSTFKNSQRAIIEAIMSGGKIGVDFQIKVEDIVGADCVDTDDEAVVISSFGFAESYRIIIGTSKAKTKIEVFLSTQQYEDEKSILRFSITNAGKSCFITGEAFATPVFDALLRASVVDGYYKPFFEVIVNFMKLES